MVPGAPIRSSLYFSYDAVVHRGKAPGATTARVDTFKQAFEACHPQLRPALEKIYHRHYKMIIYKQLFIVFIVVGLVRRF